MFVVDFDELKQGSSSGADAGTTEPAPSPEPSPGGGGGPTGGGSNGGGNGPGPTPQGGGGTTSGPDCVTDPDCDDGDSCTTDTCAEGACANVPLECTASNSCAEASCVDGACVEVPVTGVVADGLEFSIEADQVHRSTIIAGPDRFFYAVYGVFNGSNDLRLGGFLRDGSDRLDQQSLASGLRNSGLDIASPGSLVIDGAGNVNVYVGVREAPVDGVAPPLGEVLRVVFDAELSLTADMARKQGSAPSFLFVSERVGPEAGLIPGGEPFVVWPGQVSDGTARNGVFYQVGDAVVAVEAPGDAFTEVPGTLSGLRAMHTETTPGAVWMTNLPEGGVDLYSGTAAGQVLEIAQCQDDASYTGYGLHASLTIDDLWTVSWSKQGAGFSSENAVVQCAGSTCQDRSGVSVGEMCDAATVQSRVNEGLRHLLVEAFPDASDPDFLFQIILLATEEAGPLTLAAMVNRIDVGPNNSEMQDLGGITIARGEAGSGPDWPDIAVIPEDRLAVTWVEPAAEGSGQDVHFARYRICR